MWKVPQPSAPGYGKSAVFLKDKLHFSRSINWNTFHVSRLSGMSANFPSKSSRTSRRNRSKLGSNKTPLFCSSVPSSWIKPDAWEENEQFHSSACELQSNDFWRKHKLNHGFASITLWCAPFRPSVSPLSSCSHPQQRLGFLSNRRPQKFSTRLSSPWNCSVITTAGWLQD